MSSRPARAPRFKDATVTLVIVIGALAGLAPVAVGAVRADTGSTSLHLLDHRP